MKPLTPELTQLLASRRRPQEDIERRFLQAHGEDIGKAMSIGSDALYGLITERAGIAADLTYVPMTQARKIAISRAYYDEQPQVLRMLAEAQRWSQGGAGAGGPAPGAAPSPPGTTPPAGGNWLGGVQPERLESWAAQMDMYARIGEEGRAGLAMALDLSLRLDALGWFLSRLVMQGLVEQLADPDVPEQEKEDLRDGFKDFLSYKDVVLQSLSDNKDLLAQADEQIQARLEESRKDELLLQVEFAVEQGHPVDDAVLAQAARWWAERKAQAAAGGGTQVATGGTPQQQGTGVVGLPVAQGDTRKTKR